MWEGPGQLAAGRPRFNARVGSASLSNIHINVHRSSRSRTRSTRPRLLVAAAVSHLCSSPPCTPPRFAASPAPAARAAVCRSRPPSPRHAVSSSVPPPPAAHPSPAPPASRRFCLPAARLAARPSAFLCAPRLRRPPRCSSPAGLSACCTAPSASAAAACTRDGLTAAAAAEAEGLIHLSPPHHASSETSGSEASRSPSLVTDPDPEPNILLP